MNTNATNDTQGLVTRLDDCLRRVESPEAQSQGLVYAAFLTDVEKGRVNAQTPAAQDAMSVVRDFCDLVDKSFPIA